MNRRLGLDEEMCVLQDIGVELHLSRERVRQIENQAIKKLRKMCPQLRDYLID